MAKKRQFYCSKMILGNSEQFWKKIFFHLRKCQNTFEPDIDLMVHVMHGAADIMRCAVNRMCSAADMMHGVQGWTCETQPGLTYQLKPV